MGDGKINRSVVFGPGWNIETAIRWAYSVSSLTLLTTDCLCFQVKCLSDFDIDGEVALKINRSSGHHQTLRTQHHVVVNILANHVYIRYFWFFCFWDVMKSLSHHFLTSHVSLYKVLYLCVQILHVQQSKMSKTLYIDIEQHNNQLILRLFIVLQQQLEEIRCLITGSSFSLVL